ncbi:MAG: T9SS type A sorting domain-containing protein [Bacteroidetes bacterium]|nr:T9SS type A sorting domain-containing protein [Bacteroidota bacterium]
MKKILLSATLLVACLLRIQAQDMCLKPGTTYSVGLDPYGICSADFNGDGHPDVATANSGDNTISVLMGSATGAFIGQTTYSTSGASPLSVCSADFNSDGYPDIAATNSGSNNISLLLGSAAGTFSPAITYSVGTMPYSICSTDFNGDGKPDVATANYGSNDLSILLGAGGGSFSAAVIYSTGNGGRSIVNNDYNGDGFQDVIVANSNDNTISVLLGTGTGALSAQTTYSVGTNPHAVCSADFNGDGHPDLAVANNADGNISILLGSVTGTLSIQATYSVGTTPQALCSADFNSDGHMDVAVTNYGDGTVSILLGSATGTLSPQTTYSVGSEPTAICSADFNSDGHPDIATANYNNSTVSALQGSLPDVIKGQADTSGTLITHSAWVYLYQHLSSNLHLAAVDSMQIQTNGTYSFSVATPGNYFVGVAPDTTVYHRYITTYYNSTHPVYLWDSAQFVSIGGCNNATYTANISLIQTPAVNPLATGIISGNVQSDGTYVGHRMAQGGNNSVMGVPLRGIGMSLGKVPGGGCAARTATDASGNYAFSHVEVGNYIVYVDLPNYKRDSSYHVSISATGSVSTNNNYLVDSTSIYTTHATGIKQFASGSHNVWIYPNPAGSQLHIQSSAALGSISVYNALGQTIEVIQSKENTTTLDVSSYAPGLYTVLLSSGYSTFVKE